MNRRYDPDIIRRERYYDRRLGAGTANAMNMARYAAAAYRLAKKGAEAYTWYKVAKGPSTGLSKQAAGPSGPTNKSGMVLRSGSSLSQNDRGRKRTSTDLQDMVRNIRRRTPRRSRSRGRSLVRQPSRNRSRSRSRTLSIRRGRGGRVRYVPRRTIRSRMRSILRRRPRPLNATTYGCSFVQENSGILQAQSSGSVYIGHGLATSNFWQCVAAAIMKKLFRIAGEDIDDWGKSKMGVNLAQTLQIRYSINTNPTTTLYDNSTINTAVSYRTIAAALAIRFNQITQAIHGNLTFYGVWLINTPNPVPPGVDTYWSGEPQAMVDMSHMKVKYSVTSILKIQNVSLAGLVGDAAGDEDTTENLSRNPLVGKMYYQPYRCNGFKVETLPITATGGPSLVAAHDTGMILFNTDNLQNNAEFFVKPPQGHMLQCKAKPFGISPGVIKTLKWTDTRTIKYHSLIEKSKINFTTDGVSHYDNIGKVQMVGLEKKMNCAGNERLINVHWALQQHINVVVTTAKARAPRIVNIVAPPNAPPA